MTEYKVLNYCEITLNETNLKPETKMTTYEIFLNGSLVETVSLLGIAFIKYDSAVMLGNAKLVRVIERDDPVLSGRFTYDSETGGWE